MAKLRSLIYRDCTEFPYGVCRTLKRYQCLCATWWHSSEHRALTEVASVFSYDQISSSSVGLSNGILRPKLSDLFSVTVLYLLCPISVSMDLFDDLPEPVNEGVLNSNGSGCTVAVEAELCPRKRTATEVDPTAEIGTKKSCTVSNRDLCMPTFKGYVAERKGEREDMQDAHVILDDYRMHIPHLEKSELQLSFYGVFDGHAGSKASNFASNNLYTNLASRFPKGEFSQIEKELKKSFTDAFKKTDDDFLKEATKQKPSWKDGTTALAVLVMNSTLYIANLGDSKAVLCRYCRERDKNTPVLLSKEHNPSDYDERMRIQKMGGYVRDGRVMGILEVSRSIGDGQYKTFGVTCTPEIKRCQLTSDDHFLIMACDGLWKVFTAEMAIDFVTQILQDKSLISMETKCVEDVRFEVACQRLASEAVRKGSGDNVTVVIVAINWPST